LKLRGDHPRTLINASELHRWNVAITLYVKKLAFINNLPKQSHRQIWEKDKVKAQEANI